MPERYGPPMKIEQLEPGLWWWSAPHPEWSPDADKDEKGWQETVSSYALLADDELVLFDPLVVDWEPLDEHVASHGPPAVLITIFWHVRSSQEILDRYEGATLWAHEPAAEWIGERARYTNTFTPGDRLPGGVETLAMHHVEEVAYWLPTQKAAVIGDTLLGRDGAARLLPCSWIRDADSLDAVRGAVHSVLKFPSKRLLLTHGGPTDPGAIEV
jgi:glyoxylase-like metal-dependent hydrolase (beta-lactamase superfamily II)